MKKTTLAGFEPARENPMDFKSIALTARPQCLLIPIVLEYVLISFYQWIFLK